MNYYGLTGPQLGIWETEQLFQGTAISNVGGTLLLDEVLDFELCEQAFNRLVEMNDTFRVHIKVVDGKPLQYLTEYRPIKMLSVDFTGQTQEEQGSWLSSRMQAPFSIVDNDLFEALLLRACDGRQGFFLKFHHIIVDGWTTSLLVTRIMAYYRQLAAGEELHDNPSPSYLEYIENEQRYLSSAKYGRDREYWLGKLSHWSVPVSLKAHDQDSYGSEAQRLSFAVDDELAAAVRAYCKRYSTSPPVLLEAALSIYLSRVLDTQEVTIGTPVLNRSRPAEKATCGMFVSTVPVVISVDEAGTFNELCAAVRSEHRSVFRHQRYPYNQLLEEIRKKQKITHNLFDIGVSYQNAKIVNRSSALSANAKADWCFNGHQVEQLRLHIDERNDDGIILLSYDYLSQQLSEDEIRDLHRRIILLLEQGVHGGDIRIREMELVDEMEREELLYGLNTTPAGFPRDKLIHQLFEEQAEKTPDSCALVLADEVMTYGELNARANGLAVALRHRGVGDNVIVGMLVDRSFEMIVGILAIMKAGGAYLPIDPEIPKERVAFILEDSGVRICLSKQELSRGLELDGELVLDYSARCSGDEALTLQEVSDTAGKARDAAGRLAYVIYTSGTTGKPKGAMVTHENLVQLLFNDRSPFDFGATDVWTMFHSYCFDFSVWEIFGALLFGGKLVIVPQEVARSTADFLSLLKSEKVTVLNQVPASFYSLAEEEMRCQDRGLSTRYVIFGGDALKPSLLQGWRSRYPDTRLVNMYGITETTVHVSYKEISDAEVNSDTSNIGTALPTLSVYLMDRFGKLVPKGMAGELCVGGAGVCSGYLNQEELTREKFVRSCYTDEVLYRSGDLARWSGDELEYLGRIDHQVKIRGFRIELAEVERRLQECAGVSRATVVAKDDGLGSKCLVAYYLTEAEVSADELRSSMSDFLPEYMVPSYFMRVDAWPLTSNGKLDRKALPIPSLEDARTRAYVAPRTELESRLADRLSDLLKVERVGIDDHFFYDLGGSSLTVVRYQAMLAEQGVDIRTQAVYMYPTVRQLAASLGQQGQVVQGSDHADEDISPRFRSFGGGTRGLSTVLLTGASGYLGAHLLSQLLDTTSAKVYCLLRDEGRFMESMEHYFKSTYAGDIGTRVFLVEGDLEEPKLGIDAHEYGALCQAVDTVIHPAANVSHFGLWNELYRPNVYGTREVVRFSMKAGARLHHISTITVAGEGFSRQSRKRPLFSEDKLYVGQDYRSNGYVHSKYLAEKEVLAGIDDGLDACIYRSGNIMWRELDGVFQKNVEDNGFMHRIKALRKIGVLPEVALPMVDMIPVNRCAEAIVKLATTTSRCEVFHVFNDNQISFQEMLRMAGASYRHVPLDEFVRLVSKAKEDESIGVLYLYLDGIKEFIQQMQVRVENKKTRKKLAQVGIHLTRPDRAYFDAYFARNSQRMTGRDRAAVLPRHGIAALPGLGRRHTKPHLAHSPEARGGGSNANV